jgi:hypothetical protein
MLEFDEAASRLGRLARTVLLMIGTLAILFAGANLAARIFLRTPSLPNDVFAAMDWPGSVASKELYRKVFKLAANDDPMARFNASPPLVLHPTLPFATQRIDNRYYRVGLEGIRYEPGWNDEAVGALLAGSKPLIFTFGGSTTFGHGLAGDETWPYMLNGILGTNVGTESAATRPVVVNFGAQAYDQRTEIDKLIYLLRRGYRPTKVVMLDGWNDLFIARSNMRAVDRVVYHGFAQGRGEIAITPGGIINRPSYLHLLLEYSPLQQLIRHWQDGPRRIETVKFDRDAFVDGFDFREADFAFRHWALFGEHHRERYKREIVEYYQTNLTLLKALAEAYGFVFHVFYQPIGLLDDTNPFVSARARWAPGYRYISELVASVREAIASGDIQMIDVSNALTDMPGPRYLDVAHYSPEANAVLARTIANQCCGATSATNR